LNKPFPSSFRVPGGTSLACEYRAKERLATNQSFW
jgi:hypothetical protein